MENDFVRWLDGCCSGIASLEAEGGARRVAGDVEAFRDVMHEKAMLLAGMAREGEPHIVALPERMREKARLRLARFTASAENALALDSVSGFPRIGLPFFFKMVMSAHDKKSSSLFSK